MSFENVKRRAQSYSKRGYVGETTVALSFIAAHGLCLLAVFNCHFKPVNDKIFQIFKHNFIAQEKGF